MPRVLRAIHPPREPETLQRGHAPLHIRNNLVFYIKPTIDIDQHWITVTMPKLFKYPWRFETPEDATRQGFGNFPFHLVKVVIRVKAPGPEDSGQLVVLWHRINQLVQLLHSASSVKRIELVLDQEGEHTWVQDGQARTSIRL
ncbi:hypothetical protein BDV19DRAFT_352269 [Aspergillus venezuelensis]